MQMERPLCPASDYQAWNINEPDPGFYHFEHIADFDFCDRMAFVF